MFDPKLGVDLLKQNARLVEGKVVFFDADGNPAMGPNFSPLTPAQAAHQMASERPYLCRSMVKGGIGSTPANRVPDSTVKLEDLFGPRSDGGAANRLAMRDPLQYRELRRRAVEKGLVR